LFFSCGGGCGFGYEFVLVLNHQIKINLNKIVYLWGVKYQICKKDFAIN